jgi:hypothetical protein
MSQPSDNPFQHIAAGVNATTAALLRTAYEFGVFSVLDRRQQRVVGRYFTTDIGLRGLLDDAGLPTSESVRRFLLRSLRDLRAALPAQLREEYPPEELSIRQSYGYHLSRETRAKMSAAQKGRPSHHLGKHHSEAAKAKMRAAKKGHSVSLETRAKMRAARKGKPSPYLGKHHSEEAKAKMRASQRLRWQKRKRASSK